MKFIDIKHEEFFTEKMKELQRFRKTDVYYKSLVFTLSICETTRKHFKEIFDVEKGEVNINSLQAAWQTGTSAKVTRMAFNLWNNSIVFDSEEDLENGIISSNYTPSEIFCCSYAPYFWEAIQIRYPEYAEGKTDNKEFKIFTYCRVANKEQLINNDKVGIYIRKNNLEEIINDKQKLLEYCNKNDYDIIKEYIDQGYSGLDNKRPALTEMIEDLKNGKINIIVVKDIATLYRNPLDMLNLLEHEMWEEKNIQICSLDKSVEEFMAIDNNFYEVIKKDIAKIEDEELVEE